MVKTLYKQVTVTPTGGVEVTKTGVTSTEAEPKTIDAICGMADGTPGNYLLVAYVEREKIIDRVDATMFVEDGAFPAQWLPIDLELPVGQEFKVGFYTPSAVTTAKDIVIKYHLR